MRTSSVALTAVLLVLPVAACTATNPKPVAGPSEIQTSTPQATTSTPDTSATLGEIDTVVELKDAAVEAGYECSNWNQTNAVTLATESGNCSDSDVFSVYSSESARDEIVAFAKENGDSSLSLLVGPNWIINGPGAPLFADKLGGDVIDGDDVEPEPDPPAAASFSPSASDFKIILKILKKKCFGSAGCNVTYRIDPEYVGEAAIPDSGKIEVTYAVKGLEDGEAVNTFTITGSRASFDAEESGQTKSSKSTLSASVTDVTYDPEG